MSQSSRAQAPRANWWKVCAALPAVAMIGGGIALTAPAEPTSIIKNVAASSGSPAIVVPEVPLTIPPVSANPALPAALAQPSLSESAKVANSVVTARVSGEPLVAAAPAAAPLAPALVVPSGIVFADSKPATPDGTGIPVRALEGYRLAVALIDTADPDCNIDWALLAAIGSVESDHARFGGNQLDSAGVAQPGIIGIPLNGSNGTARITDSDGGLLDRDSVFDRAVGPMQFIPGTWRIAGADADGDGVKNPQSMADAAAASAIYLCSGPGDLSQQGDLRAAILRYNASDSYVQKVTGIASTYRLGVDALPASDLPFSDLPALDLSGSDLPRSDLSGSDLPRSDLSGSDVPRFDRQASDLPRSGRPAGGSAVSTPAAAAPAQPIKAVPASAARRASSTPTTLPSARKPAATPVASPAIPRPRTSVTVKPTPTTPKAPVPAPSTQSSSSGTSTQSPTPAAPTQSPTPAAPTQSPTPAALTQSPTPAAPTQSSSSGKSTQSPTPAAPTQSPSQATSTPVPTPCVSRSGEDDRVARPDDNSGRDPAKC